MGLVDIYIASLWRGGHVVKTLQSLLKCPEFGTALVVCNNYTDEQIEQVRKELNYDLRISLVKGDNKKGCSEKFKFINSGHLKYIGIIDDDLTVDSKYLSRLIKAADKYKAVVSYHGKVLKTERATNYHAHRSEFYHCRHDVIGDHFVDIVGSGVCLFRRDLFPNIGKIYDSIKFSNMSDIYLSAYALLRNVKRVVIAHPAGCVKAKIKEEGDNYIFDERRNNCEIETQFINKIFLGYDR